MARPVLSTRSASRMRVCVACVGHIFASVLQLFFVPARNIYFLYSYRRQTSFLYSSSFMHTYYTWFQTSTASPSLNIFSASVPRLT